jgi:hypothetical protein
LLTPADVQAFSILCELVATAERASSQKENPTEALYSRKLERQTAAVLRPYLAMFGLTPADRARLRVPPVKPGASNPLDKFLHRPHHSKWAGLLP